MRLPRPPWEFRSDRDHLEFKAWLNQQLNKMDEPTTDEIHLEVEMMNDMTHIDAVEKDFRRRLQRSQVSIAAEQHNFEALNRLTANDLHLKNLAFRKLAPVRARGRQKGDARPRNLSHVEKTLLKDALHDLERIKEICIRHWKRWKGSEPIAIEVAANRSGLKPEQLRNFKKNRVRDSAS